MSDIDLTEAMNAARLAWHAESDACGRGLGGPSAGELADAMIRAAAPIIARQVAGRIAERIEAESDRRDQPGLTWAAETSTHRKAGWDAGMTTAARIAREVGSGG